LEEEKKAYKEHFLQTQNKLAATNAHCIPATLIQTQSNFTPSHNDLTIIQILEEKIEYGMLQRRPR
jgi:hypothetical protein